MTTFHCLGDSRLMCVPAEEIPPGFPLSCDRWIRQEGRSVKRTMELYPLGARGWYHIPIGELVTLIEFRRLAGMGETRVAARSTRQVDIEEAAELYRNEPEAVQKLARDDTVLGVQLWYTQARFPVPRLLTQIADAFPEASISVVATTKRQSRECNVAFDAHCPQRLLAGRQFGVEQPPQIQIGLPTQLDPHHCYHSDFILVPDPVAALRPNIRRLIVERCPRSRLVGLLEVSRGLAPYDERRVNAMFSCRAISIGDPLLPRPLEILTRRYNFRGHRIDGGTRLAKKRRLLWRNRDRNQLIQECCEQLERRLIQQQNPGCIVVVVETIEHVLQLLRLIPTASVRRSQNYTHHGLDATQRFELENRRWTPSSPPPTRVSIATLTEYAGIPSRHIGGLVVAHGLPVTCQIHANSVDPSQPRLPVVEIVDHGDADFRYAASERRRTYGRQGAIFTPFGDEG